VSQEICAIRDEIFVEANIFKLSPSVRSSTLTALMFLSLIPSADR